MNLGPKITLLLGPSMNHGLQGTPFALNFVFLSVTFFLNFILSENWWEYL